mgnify:CR=1 FL=1
MVIISSGIPSKPIIPRIKKAAIKFGTTPIEARTIFRNKTKNIKKETFCDPNMKIKKSIPERRRSFRARHNCDNPGPKTKARYWSCRKW